MPISQLIGLAAGLIAAVVFVSATTGPPLAQLALYLLTPLPLYLAGLGLGWKAAAAGTGAGFLALALATSPVAGLMFAASSATPATILTYLATLSRPLRPAVGVSADQPFPTPPREAGSAALEWYPIGRLVLWAALMAGLLVVAAILTLGQDVAGIKASLEPFVRALFVEQLPQTAGAPPLGDEEITQLTEIAVYAMPAAGAISLMSVMLANLYLAGHITLASGRLLRPWPDLGAIAYPPRTPWLLAGAVAATFLPGVGSLMAAGFAGSLYLAYVLLGLAIVHYVTRGQTWRRIALTALYFALVVMNSGVSLMIAILGLVDSFTALRRPRPPPSAPPMT